MGTPVLLSFQCETTNRRAMTEPGPRALRLDDIDAEGWMRE